MITVISNVHTGDLILPGLLAVGLFLLGYLGKVFIDEWRDHMRHHARPQLVDEYADDVPDQPYSDRDYTLLADEIGLPGDREHSWPNIAPLLIETGPTDNPAAYPLSLAPDLDEDQAPTDPSGKHAEGEGRVSVDEVTGYVRLTARIPDAMDDTAALAVVAAVSGEDGAG